MIPVHHVDGLFEMTDAKLAFEQHQLQRRMMTLIAMDNMTMYELEELELATDISRQYSDVISQRQSNIEKQQRINQLDLFSV